MNKHAIGLGALVLAIAIFIGGLFYYKQTINNVITTNDKTFVSSSPKNATYKINGQYFTLKDGVSDIEVASSSKSMIVTQYFGNEVRKDLDSDGREDVVFLLTQSTGGSGTFFYVVAALNKEGGYVGSEGLLLGDRIAPQTTELDENNGRVNVVVVNYADRKAGEAMTTQPSIGKSIWIKLDPRTMQFGEVVQNFEGEANPNVMSLSMKDWRWIKTIYNNDSQVVPAKVDKFTITFGKDGRFSATTDCNNISGSYSVDRNNIYFGQMASTKMFCENSQEDVFTKSLTETQSYHFTSKGELVFGLKFDSGSFIFK